MPAGVLNPEGPELPEPSTSAPKIRLSSTPGALCAMASDLHLEAEGYDDRCVPLPKPVSFALGVVFWGCRVCPRAVACSGLCSSALGAVNLGWDSGCNDAILA